MDKKIGEKPKKENLPENEELAKRLIEQIIEESQFADAGAEGLVYKLNGEAIPKDFEGLLKAQGVEIEGDIASKILKVYTRGQGAVEYRALRKMWNLIDSLPDSKGFAKVPKPIFLQEIPVTESLKETLGQRGDEIAGDKVEVILMDFIEGDDLFTILYKKALKIIQKEEFSAEAIEGMDFQSLARYTQDEYFRKTQAVAEKVEGPLGDDAFWLHKLLKENGYVPDPSIIQQIKKTVELMQKKGISHGDLHPRNIKIYNGQVYFLDFGKANGSWESMSDEERGERIGDEVLIGWLKDFSQTSQKKSEKIAGEYIKTLERISAKPRISAKYESLKEELIKNPSAKLSQMFERLNLTDDEIDAFCSYIYKLAKESPEAVPEISEFIKNAISKSSGLLVSKLQILEGYLV